MNDEFLKNLLPNRGQREVYDQTFVGSGSFGVRVNKSGSKSFFLVYKLGGRRKRLTLGKYPELSLEEARFLALQESERVEQGYDPAAEKKSWKVAETISELCQLFLEDLRQRGRKEKTIKEYRRIIERELAPAWSDRKIGDIRPSDVIFLLDRVSGLRESKVMAERIRALLSSLFSFALKKGLIEKSPVADLPRPEPIAKELRLLSKEELALIWQALEADSPSMQGIFKLLILTGQKPAEVCSMRWQDIQLETWKVSDGLDRGKRSHQVFLSPVARETLAAIQSQGDFHQIYVFPSTKSKSNKTQDLGGVPHIQHIRKAAERIQARASLDLPWSPADIRRSFPSLLVPLKIRPDVIERILNRHPGNTHLKGFYEKFDYQEDIKKALQRWSRQLMQEVSPKKPPKGESNVVPLFS